jgi:glycosyltransferase involved in cell wall biosynthesis/predicted flap endonuclease-1-like 5' DNA nuclease
MLVSTVTPVYNLAHTLPQALASLTNQTYRDLEIIVIDDGSPDNAGAVADRLAETDDRITVIHQENKGLPAALNVGFGRAKGDAFIILSPDDLLHPTTIAKQVDRMQSLGVDIVSTDMLVGGKPVETRALDLKTQMKANCHGYAALFKKWVFEHTGGFKLTMNPSWEDYEFFLHAAKLGARAARIAEPLFIYQPNPKGRGAEALGQDRLLRGKMEGYHQDIFGRGRGEVAVVIPCYGHEKFVREAAETALAQIYPHIKVIIVDDGSPGDTMEALEGLPVYLIKHRGNRGLSAARNTGIQAAIVQFGCQYFVCEDADDGLDKMFIERTMGAVPEDSDRYVYTDIRFIGDAYHDFEVKDWDCEELWTKHLHACTFLAETKMWSDVVKMRGYGYDENMRQGFEDWEFVLACVEAGWCGYRLREPLFHYRWHKNGSMRTRALEIKGQLGRYIHSRHRKEHIMGSCCGGSGTRRPAGAIQVAGAEYGQPYQVQYTGGKTGTMRKIGRRRRIYSYRALLPREKAAVEGGQTIKRPDIFFIDECDLNLFEAGPYIVKKLEVKTPQQAAAPLPVVPVSPPPPPPRPVAQRPPPPTPTPVAQKLTPVAQMTQTPPPPKPLSPEDLAQAQKMVSGTYKDDLTRIKGVGKVTAKRLRDTGFSTFQAIVKANVMELAQTLKISVNKAQEIINGAHDVAG